MTSSVEVVVAKHKENISWLGHIRHRVTIYDKSDNPVNGSQRLENIGRESHTYLYHIVSRYNTLSDITIFVQGIAYDHCDLLGNSEDRVIQYINNIVNIDSPFEPLCQPLRTPTWAAADVKTWYDRARSKPIFRTPVVEDTPFAFGAQYIVRKDTILSKSHAFWKMLYEMSKTSIYGDDRKDRIDPWTLEMMWPCIFDPARKESDLKIVKSVMIDDCIGFADFLRGGITLKLLSRSMGYVFELDYSKHAIREYLNNINCTDIAYERDNISTFVVGQGEGLLEFLRQPIGPLFVLTNMHYFSEKITPNVFHRSQLDEELRSFLKTSIEPRERVLSGVDEYLEAVNMKKKEYVVVHARIGDGAFLGNHGDKLLFDSYVNRLLPHVGKNDVLILSDDITFKLHACQKTDWKTLTCHIGHTAKQHGDSLGVLNTLIEFFVMSHASSIVHLTTYSTGPSGFSRWCAEIFDIPYLEAA